MRIFMTLALALLFNTAVTAQPTLTFTNELPDNELLVLGVHQKADLGTLGKKLDAQGDITHAIKATAFEAKPKSSLLIPAPKGSGFNQILLVGLGEKDAEHSDLDWQNIGGQAVQDAVEVFETAPVFAFDVSDASNLALIAYGAKIGSYYFDKYYTDSERHKRQKSIVMFSENATSSAAIYEKTWEPVANAIYLTRDISNEPANVIFPQSFVDTWLGHFKGMDNIKIRTYDEKDMIKQGMGAIHGVGKGSARQPRMMVVEYMGGDKGDKPVVVVGKGITFDTGGISLKNPKNMWNMKFDMSGAAAAMGTLYALAGQKAEVNLVAIAALAENMPSSNAQRPGDVVTSMSGKTIQIRSTDAEGRLVLADAIHYGDVKYDPALLIDLATLTGSASRALGKDYGAMFTRHDDLVAGFMAAGKASGDEVWQLPLNDNHFKAIENDVADVMNSGPDAPGASAGAAFIGAFVRESTPWVHFDIAGVAWGNKAKPHNASPGSTGFGVRLLNHYIKNLMVNN